jgi:hypothetical protein
VNQDRLVRPDPVIRKEDRSRLVVIKRDDPTLSQLIEPVVLREPQCARSSACIVASFVFEANLMCG